MVEHAEVGVLRVGAVTHWVQLVLVTTEGTSLALVLPAGEATGATEADLAARGTSGGGEWRHTDRQTERQVGRQTD